MSSDCIFCKIVKGEIPCYKVFEDEDVLAFLDIHPRNPGHTLVIPKKHYRWVWDIPFGGKFYERVFSIAGAIKKSMQTDWVVSLVFGEEVHHAHVWLVPRFENDGHGGGFDVKNFKDISKDEMKSICDKIRESI